MALSLGYDYFPCARSIQQQKKGKNFIFSNTRPSSAGQGSCEHFYFYFQASSSDVSLLLVSVSESSHSAMQVLLHGENRLELRPCKKPFFTNPFLRSCSVLVWNSLSSSSVSGRQLSSFSGYSCHPIAFNNLEEAKDRAKKICSKPNHAPTGRLSKANARYGRNPVLSRVGQVTQVLLMI